MKSIKFKNSSEIVFKDWESKIESLVSKYEDMPADDFVDLFVETVGDKSEEHCICDCEKNYGKRCLDGNAYLKGGCK